MFRAMHRALIVFLSRDQINAAIERARVSHSTGMACLCRAHRLRRERNALERLPPGKFTSAEATICESLFRDEARARYFAGLHFSRRDNRMDDARQIAEKPRKPLLFFKGAPIHYRRSLL